MALRSVLVVNPTRREWYPLLKTEPDPVGQLLRMARTRGWSLDDVHAVSAQSLWVDPKNHTQLDRVIERTEGQLWVDVSRSVPKLRPAASPAKNPALFLAVLVFMILFYAVL